MAEVHQNTYKTQLLISAIVLIIGLILLVFMITVEDEPGALPLVLVLGGLIWQFAIRRKRKLQNQ